MRYRMTVEQGPCSELVAERVPQDRVVDEKRLRSVVHPVIDRNSRAT